MFIKRLFTDLIKPTFDHISSQNISEKSSVRYLEIWQKIGN